jgi:class 3 adenylate cyclase
MAIHMKSDPGVLVVLKKLQSILDYRLSPELEIEYIDKTIELTNKIFVIGLPLMSVCLWVFYLAHNFSGLPGNVFSFVVGMQIVLCFGIFAILFRGQMRRALNYFTPVMTLGYVYALMGVYVATLPDQTKMLQAQNWVICLVFLLYAIERLSPFFAIWNAASSTVLFYYLQAKVPQLASAAAFQFNWQMLAAHGAGLLICFDQCGNARRKFKYEKELEAQRRQSDDLLRNVLPEAVVDELKTTTSTLAHAYQDVTVIFIDLVGFTKKSSTMEPSRLVTLLDDLFSRFDELASKHGVEKIKTIGDAYMAATGCPNPDRFHAHRMVDFALEIDGVIKSFNQDFSADFGVKVGLASGAVMGGVIGKKRISFDLWGDVVNLASRIESIAAEGEVAVSESTANLIKDKFAISKSRVVDLKGKGPTTVYSILPRGASPQSAEGSKLATFAAQQQPNASIESKERTAA